MADVTLEDRLPNMYFLLQLRIINEIGLLEFKRGSGIISIELLLQHFIHFLLVSIMFAETRPLF